MSQLLSGKVKVVRPTDVSEDRYEYLRLNEAEPNLGVPESGSLSSGSIALVASDADGNRLFVTTLQLDQVTGSFSGSFAGDGSELNNLPDVQQLRSGSVSASIAPNTGFLVNVSASIDGDLDLDGTARITGDLIVDNRIVARELIVEIISSSILFSTGSNIFGDELTDKQEFTGSVEMTGSLSVDGDTNISGGLFVTGGNVQLSSGSFFSGSGEGLFNIPKSALTDDALLSNLITTGSVTASVSTDGFFRVFSTGSVTTELSGSLLVSGNIEINSGSSFSGSGENLFNIPKSALTEDALLSNLITTGSVTASVSNDGFFRVFSTGSVTSEFSGSVFVSGNIQLNVSSSFSGSGANLFDIPRSALTEDALETNLIISGAVTASTSPDEGFVVTSVDSGSTFSGSIFLSSGSFFSGSGEQLFNIPRSALTEDALISNLITTGSVTASVSTDGLFRVQGTGSVTTELSGSLFVSGNVEINSGSSFSGSGANLFNIPRTALTDDALISNLIATGSVTASVSTDGIFRVESTGSVKSEFSGSVFVSESLEAKKITADEFTGSFSGSFAGDGSQLNNIPQSALSEDASRIASGSVTASVSPNLGFVVNSSGSIQGDLTVDNDLFVGGRITAEELYVNFISSSIIYSSGSNIFGDDSGSDTQKLFGETQIFGNVTASGVISSSGFIGDGAGLFNIPQSALSEDAPLISTGSVTASVDVAGFFRVSSTGSVTTELSGSLFVSGNVQINSGSIYSGSGAG